MKNLLKPFRLMKNLLKIPKFNKKIKFREWSLEEVETYKNEPRPEQIKDEIIENDILQIQKKMKKVHFNTKKYEKLSNEWKNNLIRKKKKKERKNLREAQKPKILSNSNKLILHSPLLTKIEITKELLYNSFAVISLNGRQYKIKQDDVITVIQMKEFEIGDLLKIDQINLIGNKYFTILGRPICDNSTVYLRVEEQSYTQKVLVFKKKRRKGYQRTMGYRQGVTRLRVEKVEYDVSDDVLERAVLVD